MISNYNALKKYVFRSLRKIIRTLFDFLPIKINQIFAKKGYTYFISRKKKFEFKSNIYGTKLLIKADSQSNIDRVATSNMFINDDFTYSYPDPIKGIFNLNLENWTMIDIGANVGTYSIAATEAGATKVYAIEPGRTFKRLKYNVNLNKLQKKVKIYNFGISKSNGYLNWYEELNNIGNAHLLKDKNDIDLSKTNTFLNENFIKVKVRTLNSFVKENKIDQIDLIKIDVEGMEWDIIKNCEKIIKHHKPILLIETHRMMSDIIGYDCITPIFNFLYKLNYKSYSFENNRFVDFIYPNFPMDTFFIPKKNSNKNN